MAMSEFFSDFSRKQSYFECARARPFVVICLSPCFASASPLPVGQPRQLAVVSGSPLSFHHPRGVQ
jgi:hypothetical protein